MKSFNMTRLNLFCRYQHLVNNNYIALNQVILRNVDTLYVDRTKWIKNSYTKYDTQYKICNFKRYYSSKSYSNEEKIFKSIFPEVKDYYGLLYHELVWKNIDKWLNKTALVCAMTGRFYTYEQTRRLSGRFATSLRKCNLQPGDTIAAILPNVPEYAIVLMGASEAGVQVTLINPIYIVEEMKKQLISSETKLIITIPAVYSIVENITTSSGVRLPIVVIEDGNGLASSGTINFKEMVSDDIEEFEKTSYKTERDPETDTLFLPYSSGTTGLPKGVELTHRNLLATFTQGRIKELTYSEEAFGDHQEIVPIFLPIYHCFGFNCVACYLSVGAKLICMPQFSSLELLKVFEKNRLTCLYVVPPILQLMAYDERFTYRHMESVKLITSGAATLSKEIVSKLLSRCGDNLNIVQGYGVSESSGIAARSKKGPLESSGLLVPNTQIRIVGCEGEKTGKNLGPNELGEIYIKGPQVMKGYFKNPQATRETMDGEWLKTGDLGSIDDQGFLYVKGRLKELIKVQAYQVAPAELEDILQGHGKVADVAVIGVPHDKFGEIPKAFIVLKPNMHIDEQEIKDFVAKRVAKYKQLGHVVVIDKIPKSAAGKILRRELQKI